MGKFSGVLLALDLDGTHLNEEKYVCNKNAEAVEYFMSEGGYFTFATGRLLQSFKKIIPIVTFNTFLIFANGAQIYDFENDKLLLEHTLPINFGLTLKRILDKYDGTAAEIYRHLECDTINENEITQKHMENFGIDRTIRKSIRDIKLPWVKVLLTNSHECLKEIERKLESYDNINMAFSTPVFLEIFSKTAHKGLGVKTLARMLNVEDKHIYTAGDQENDLDLLNAASISFAPENAMESVLSTADIILPSNDNSMTAALIAHLDSIY